jgi:two-component system sensor histidine kinase UhpB
MQALFPDGREKLLTCRRHRRRWSCRAWSCGARWGSRWAASRWRWRWGCCACAPDTEREMAGSLTLAQVGREAARLAGDDPAQVLAALRALQDLRHLRVEVFDGDGRRALTLPPDAVPASADGWSALARELGVTASEQSVSWPVVRTDGRRWTVVLTTSPDSELKEAMANLGGAFLFLSGGSVVMLAVMGWNVRRAFRPLQSLLAAIARLGRNELEPVRRLPTMPIGELEAISQALKHLVEEGERTEAARRVLGQRLLHVQEDERRRLARDLHDEFGQRLTGLRVDAAWLQRRLETVPALRTVAGGMADHGRHDPGRPAPAARPAACVRPGRRHAGDRRPPARDAAGTGRRLAGRRGQPRHRVRAACGRRRRHAGAAQDVLLCVYRISQEALTNVARHADAQHAWLALAIVPAGRRGRDRMVGERRRPRPRRRRGALQRGNGLRGIQDRLWALGGEFDWASGEGGGLVLRARVSWSGDDTP